MGYYNSGVVGSGSASRSLGWFSVADYGGDSTGAQSSSTAFSAALAACLAAGGGVVYFPRGTWLLTSQATLTTGTDGSSVTIMGPGGSGAVLVVSTGASADVINMVAGTSISCEFTVRDVVFRAPLGNVAGVTINCRSVVSMNAASELSAFTMTGCQFYGVWAGLDVVLMTRGTPYVSDCGMYGCTGGRTAGNYTAYIHFEKPFQGKIERVRMYDLGQFQGSSWSADGTATFGLWFVAREQDATFYSSPVSDFVVSDSFLDEGQGTHQIMIGQFEGNGTAYPWDGAEIRRVSFNANAPTGYSSIRARQPAPAGGGGSGRLTIEGCNLEYQNNQLKPGIILNGVKATRIVNCGMEVAHVSSSQLLVDDPLYRSFNGVCESIEIINTPFTEIVARGSSTYTPPRIVVTQTGVTSTNRQPDGVIGKNLYVKPSALHPGRVVVLAAADPVSLATGIALPSSGGGDPSTALATSTIQCNTAANTPTGKTVTINDGFTALGTVFEVTRGGAPAGGNIAVDISTDVTAAQVAARLFTAIGTVAPATLLVSVVNSGGGLLTLTYLGGDLGVALQTTDAVAFVVAGFTGGGQTVNVVELQGQPVTVVSDGATAIALGDPITASAATAGQSKKAAAGNLTGRALSTATAVAGASFTVLYSKEAI